MSRIDYYSTHASKYDIQITRTNDLEFFAAYVDQTDGLVVELGSGTGRISLPVAVRARSGYLGVDLYPEMVAIAREKAEAGAPTAPAFVVGDMRALPLEGAAALILIPARAFLHNLTTDDQLATLRSCHRALAAGGRLVLDVFHPNLRWIASAPAGEPGEWQAGSGQPWDEWRTTYWPTQQLTHALYRRTAEDGREETAEFTLRWVYRYEMEHLLTRTGFEVEDLFGDYDRSALSDDSPEQLWVARSA